MRIVSSSFRSTWHPHETSKPRLPPKEGAGDAEKGTQGHLESPCPQRLHVRLPYALWGLVGHPLPLDNCRDLGPSTEFLGYRTQGSREPRPRGLMKRNTQDTWFFSQEKYKRMSGNLPTHPNDRWRNTTFIEPLGVKWVVFVGGCHWEPQILSFQPGRDRAKETLLSQGV